MVRIRLRRVGARRQPYYRIVVADQRKSRNGRFIEEIGHYNPRTEPETVEYDKRRVVYWLSNGAQPSDSVKLFLKRDGIYEAVSRYQQGTPLEDLFEDEMAEEEAPTVEMEAEAESDSDANADTDVEVAVEAEAEEADDAADEDAAAEESEEEGTDDEASEDVEESA